MRELERNPTDIDAPRPALPPIALIGTGRLGGSLLDAARQAGVEAWPVGRDELAERCAAAEVALLCVPDGEIAHAATALTRAAPHLAFVGHCSGATDLQALAPAAAAGAETFSLHPLQTFPAAGDPVAGAPAAVAGSSPRAAELAHRIAEALGMEPFALSEEARAVYHAAAAIASNFLVTLEESAAGLLADAGLSDPRRLLAPLVLRTAANWVERGADALTGPIARGDAATVERHLRALAETAPELVPAYEALAERTRRLAAERPAP